MWRLSLDMGTNSLGWVAFEINGDGDVVGIKDMGVRIYSDGREPSSPARVGESKAVNRRMARGIRRNLDRSKSRKAQFMARLIKLSLMPKDKQQRKDLEALNPYELRAAAVECKLSSHELGRVLFHLCQRRGFLSNRKDSSDEKETGKIKSRISKLRQELDGLTLGQWLNIKRLKSHDASLRFRGEDGDLFADRAMYMDEFDKIRQFQQSYHNISDNDWDDLRNGNAEQSFDGIFFQRPLKPVERGSCEFFIDQYRAHKDLPISHKFRILQEVSNLQYYDENHQKHQLNAEQRKILITKLNDMQTMAFSSVRKLKNSEGDKIFPRECRFNLEEGPRDKLKGNATVVKMRNVKFLGGYWDKMTAAAQNDLLEILHAADDDKGLIKELMNKFSFNDTQARAVASFPISSATTNLSRKFMEKCGKIMRDQSIGYDAATRLVHDDDGVLFHHSNNNKVGKILQKLPYYGEILNNSVIGKKPRNFDAITHPEQHYGKINNPTVHVALNQLRKLVNQLSEHFGKPDEIHLEIIRDLKKTAKVRDEIAKKNKAFAKDNERRAVLFKEIMGHDVEYGQDIRKIRLWEELGEDELARNCPYSNKNISCAMLFNGEVEIEHILPFSRTLDNSMANLTLAMRDANRAKGNDSPYEAFAGDYHADKGMIWAEISKNAQKLPKNKRWRFDEDAMDRFDKDSGFLNRQLTDTAYIARITKGYLSHICDGNKIVTLPGGLTAMLRGKWHLNSLLGDHNHKERNDHRHHIIDAFVIGLSSRSMLQKISNNTKKGVDGMVHIKLPDIENLKAELRDKLDDVIISFKADHGVNGKMFEETALGIISDDKLDPDFPKYKYVTTKKLTALSKPQIGQIRDKSWRMRIQRYLFEAKAAGKKLDESGITKLLEQFSLENNIKKIRILISAQSAKIIPSAPFKAYGVDTFACVDIWQYPPRKFKSGKLANKFEWHGAFISYADCNGKIPDKNNGKVKTKGYTEHMPIHPAAKFITRLFKGDMIEINEDGLVKIMRVAGFSTTNNSIDIRPQFSTNKERRYISINILKDIFIRKLYINIDGARRG